ncbi:MAG TPA: alpha/beta hydrolase, partial [Blastocatellia bacterium]|nr:alpha/beta hydrolase [Blastocatellia bacterium]
ANDLNIYYELEGAGEPLLLIRGLGSTCEGFREQIRGLAPHFQVVAFDNRCVGRTDQPQQPFAIANMADDTAALLEALEIESAHVFGVSLGGMVAQELAIRHPHKVRKLVLGCTHAGPRTAIRSPDWAVKIFNESRDMPRPEALRYSIPILFARKTVDEQPLLVEAALRVMENNNQPKVSYLLQLGAVMQHDTFDRLHQITQPTLVMTGTEDALIDPGNSRLLSEHIPAARLIEFEETGHVFFTEKPDLVNSTLIDFFTSA